MRMPSGAFVKLGLWLTDEKEFVQSQTRILSGHIYATTSHIATHSMSVSNSGPPKPTFCGQQVWAQYYAEPLFLNALLQQQRQTYCLNSRRSAFSPQECADAMSELCHSLTYEILQPALHPLKVEPI